MSGPGRGRTGFAPCGQDPCHGSSVVQVLLTRPLVAAGVVHQAPRDEAIGTVAVDVAQLVPGREDDLAALFVEDPPFDGETPVGAPVGHPVDDEPGDRLTSLEDAEEVL